MTDAILLKRLQHGQQDALAALMEKYGAYVRTIIGNVLGAAGSSADVEELVSDTFYAVWRHAPSIGPGKLKPYLGVTARNQAKSWLRARKELPMDLDIIELPDPKGSPEEALVRRERGKQVRKAIHKMRPRDREIFLRYYYYLQTTEEIAAELGIPAGTVRSRLARGRKLLKAMLSKEELS